MLKLFNMLAANSPAFHDKDIRTGKPGTFRFLSEMRDIHLYNLQIISNSLLFRAGKLNTFEG